MTTDLPAAISHRLQFRALRAASAISPKTDERAVLKAFSLMAPRHRCELVRLGSPSDGGYLLPNDLDGLVGLVSPGVAEEASFDLDIASRGIPVKLLDASVTGPPFDHGNFEFIPKFLDTSDGQGSMTLGSVVASLPPGDLLLQMDIEGAEYRVLLSTPLEVLQRFRIMVLELHALEMLAVPIWGDTIAATLDRLLVSHDVVHAHGNNYSPAMRVGGVRLPTVVELTLRRRDRTARAELLDVPLPHPLDEPCDSSSRDVEFPAWGSLQAAMAAMDEARR